jgi:hypothetical protein
MGQMAICVPWRNTSLERADAWDACHDRWQRLFPDATIYEGDTFDEPFNRSAARNAAVAAYHAANPDWAIVVCADADVMVDDPDQVHHAVHLASVTGRMVFAHTWRAGLNEEQTGKVLAGAEPGTVGRAEWDRNTFSSCYAIPRRLWTLLGGFDERFKSWGGEDLAFMRMAAAFGGVDRVNGTIYHLYHPRPRAEQEEHPLYAANWALWERYRDAGTDQGALRRIRFEG